MTDEQLTDKQQIFADEYLKDLNGTRAYKVAYHNVKKDSVAAAAAVRMLRNVKVRKYIDEHLEKMQNERTADAQEVLEFLTSVMRGEKTEQVMRLDGDGVQVIDDVELQGKDRIKAAELLGKRYALFTDKQQVDIQSVTFIDDIPEDDEDD